jgi:hypothetical protein
MKYQNAISVQCGAAHIVVVLSGSAGLATSAARNADHLFYSIVLRSYSS